MAGNTIRIKRKSTVLAPRGVQVVKEEAPKAGEEAALKRATGRQGTSKIRRGAGGAGEEEAENTMKVVMEEPAAPEPAAAPSPVREGKGVVEAAVTKAEPEEVEEPPRRMSPPREVLGEPTFKFYCYRCGQKLKVPVSWANKIYPCIRCGHDITIPPPLVGEFW